MTTKQNKSKSKWSHYFDRVFITRSILCVTLLTTAGLLGYFANIQITKDTETLITNVYNERANDILNNIESVVSKMDNTAAISSSMIASVNNDINQYPNVTYPNFTQVSQFIIQTSSAFALIYSPNVPLNQQKEFEAFAYDYFQNSPDYVNDNAGINQAIGIPGIWSFGYNGSAPFLDTTGTPKLWKSKRNLLIPVFQANDPSGFQAPIIMVNTYLNPWGGRAIDDSLDCVEQNIMNNQSEKNIIGSCGKVGGIRLLANPLVIGQQEAETALVMPIILNYNYVVGFTYAIIRWNVLFSESTPSSTDGIDIVISNDIETFTYTIKNSKATYKSNGDKHDQNYDHTKKQKVLLQDTSSSLNIYTVTIYQNDEFDDEYENNLALIATVTVVVIIIFCGSLFCLYDYLMKRKIMINNKILRDKKKYVRFISHELRTPLNASKLGLELLIEDFENKFNLFGGTNNSSDSPHSPHTPHTPHTHHEHNNKQLHLINNTNNFCSSSSSSYSQSNSHSQTNTTGHIKQELYMMKEIMEFNDNAITLLDQLLDFEKFIDGKYHLFIKNIYMYPLIKKIYDGFLLLAAKKNIQTNLYFDLQEATDIIPTQNNSTLIHHLLVVVDQQKIIEIIQNLLNDSLKHSVDNNIINVHVVIKSGEYLPDVDYNMHVSDNNINDLNKNIHAYGICIIKIIDNGTILTNDQIDHFLNNDNNNKIDNEIELLQSGRGTGLALNIAKKIIKLHNGTINIECIPDYYNKNNNEIYMVTSLTLPVYYNDDPFDIESCNNLTNNNTGNNNTILKNYKKNIKKSIVNDANLIKCVNSNNDADMIDKKIIIS